MSEVKGFPWEKIYDYVMECGRQHDPYGFVVTALEEAKSLVPYDQGLVYCLDETRKVRAQHLVNIKSRWSTMYLEYYSHLQSTQRNLEADAYEMYGVPLVTQIIWNQEPLTEFVTDYIMERGVKCSLAFILFDTNALPRAAFSLDRMYAERFTEAEVSLVRMAVAPIGNLYKNFFVDPRMIPGKQERGLDALESAGLTNRQLEVAELLCKGFSPANIAVTLHIGKQTVYKHIAQIYQRLGVSSSQEFLVRVLSSRMP